MHSIYFLLLFTFINNSFQSCLGYLSQNNSCSLCDFQQFSIKSEIPIENCQDKNKTFQLSLKIAVLANDCRPSCNLSFFDKIYLNLTEAFLEINNNTQYYLYSNITFYLSKDIHMIKTIFPIEIFRRTLVEFKIKPIFCNEILIDNCTLENEFSTVFFENNLLTFFTARNFQIKNIKFQAKKQNYIENSKIFTIKNNFKDQYALFNIEMAYESNIFPLFEIKNCIFEDFELLSANDFPSLFNFFPFPHSFKLTQITIKNSLFSENIFKYFDNLIFFSFYERNESVWENQFNLYKNNNTSVFYLENLNLFEINKKKYKEKSSSLIENCLINFKNYKGNFIIRNSSIGNYENFKNQEYFVCLDLLEGSFLLENLTKNNSNLLSILNAENTKNLIITNVKITNSLISHLFYLKNISTTITNNYYSGIVCSKYLFEVKNSQIYLTNSIIKESLSISFLFEHSNIYISQISIFSTSFSNIFFDSYNSSIIFNTSKVENVFNGNTFFSIKQKQIKILQSVFTKLQTRALLSLEETTENFIIDCNFYNNTNLSYIINPDPTFNVIYFNRTSFNNSIIDIFVYIYFQTTNSRQIILENMHFFNIKSYFQFIFIIGTSQVRIRNCQFINLIGQTFIPIMNLFLFSFGTDAFLENNIFDGTGWALDTENGINPFELSIIFTFNIFSIEIRNNSLISKDDAFFRGAFFVSNFDVFVVVKNSSFQGLEGNLKQKPLQIVTSLFITIEGCSFQNFNCPLDSSMFSLVHGVVSLIGAATYSFRPNIFSVTFKENSFKNCNCKIGGALAFINYHNIIMISNSFTNSQSTIGGHFVIISATTVTISQLTLKNSKADTAGALLLYNIKKVTWTNSSISSSTAFESANVFLNYVEHAGLENLNFKEMSSKNYAGSMLVFASVVRVVNSSFSDSNSGKNGGAFFVDGASEIDVQSAKFFNVSGMSGAAIYIEYATKAVLQNITIDSASAEKFGSAIFVDQIFSFLFKNSLVNSSQCQAGSIYLQTKYEESTQNLESIICFSNTADFGSCVYIESPSKISLKNISASNCRGNVFKTSWDFKVLILFEKILLKNCSGQSNLISISGFNAKIREFSFIDCKANEFLFFLKNAEIEIFSGSFTNVNGRHIFFLENCVAVFSFVKHFLGKIQEIGFLEAKSSAILADNLKIGKISLKTAVVELTETIFYLKNTEIFDNLALGINAIGGNFSIENSFFHNNKNGDFKINAAKKEKITLFIIKSQFYVEKISVQAQSLSLLRVEKSFWKGLDTSPTSSAIDIYSCSNIEISNTNFVNLNNIKGPALYISNPTISTLLLTKSLFSKNNAQYGGAIFISGSVSGQILESFFEKNSAKIAGTIIFDLTSGNFILINNLFVQNSVSSFAPTILSSVALNSLSKNSFKNNYDAFNFTQKASSFPYKLKWFSKPEHIVSGNLFNLTLSLQDFFGNELIYQNNTIAKFLTQDPSVKRAENTIGTTIKGKVYFTNMAIFCPPNTTITAKIVIKVPANGLSFPFNVELNFTLFVRPCIVGEILRPDTSCLECPQNEYSFANPMVLSNQKQKCHRCPANANCPGGAKIIPNLGYWKHNKKSNLIFKCRIIEACLALEENSCEKGHFGNLCDSCIPGFGKSSSNSLCVPCKEKKINFILKTLGITLLVVAYIIFTINKYSNTQNAISNYSVLLKIALNFSQQIAIVSTLGSAWGMSSIGTMIDVQNSLTFLRAGIISNQCTVSPKILGIPDAFLSQVLVTVLFPIIVTSIAELIWIVIFLKKKLKKQKQNDLLNNLLLSFVMSIFLFYPLIVKMCFNSFNCKSFDGKNKKYFLTYSPNFECWTSDHFKVIFLVVIPSILVWGICFPFLFFYVLLTKVKKDKKNYLLSEENIMTSPDKNQRKLKLKEIKEVQNEKDLNEKISNNFKMSSIRQFHEDENVVLERLPEKSKEEKKDLNLNLDLANIENKISKRLFHSDDRNDQYIVSISKNCNSNENEDNKLEKTKEKEKDNNVEKDESIEKTIKKGENILQNENKIEKKNLEDNINLQENKILQDNINLKKDKRKPSIEKELNCIDKKNYSGSSDENPSNEGSNKNSDESFEINKEKLQQKDFFDEENNYNSNRNNSWGSNETKPKTSPEMPKKRENNKTNKKKVNIKNKFTFHNCWKSFISLLTENDIIKFFYEGYRRDFIYWESLIFLKKFLMALIVSFSHQLENNFIDIVIILIFYIHLWLNIKCKPFILPLYNNLEIFSQILSIFFTIFMRILECDINVTYKIAIVLMIIILIVIYYSFFLFLIGKNATKVISFRKAIHKINSFTKGLSSKNSMSSPRKKNDSSNSKKKSNKTSQMSRIFSSQYRKKI